VGAIDKPEVKREVETKHKRKEVGEIDKPEVEREVINRT
jgi:hypothetical protein